MNILVCQERDNFFQHITHTSAIRTGSKNKTTSMIWTESKNKTSDENSIKN